MSDLPFIKSDFRVIRLNPIDAKNRSDAYLDLRKLVFECEDMYPNIPTWFDGKVSSGIRDSARVAFVGYLDGIPTVSAVAKKGIDAKFCHMRIAERIQDRQLGDLFFSLMALELRSSANQVHFTLPEGLWETKKGFFNSFGFSHVDVSYTQYRKFEKELHCASSYSELWSNVLRKLPKVANTYCVQGFGVNDGVLLSIAAKYAEKVISGEKSIEIRKRFSRKWTGSKASIYACKPVGALVGEATIARVVTGSPEEIWERFSDRIGVSKTEYGAYTGTTGSVYAIELENVTAYQKRIRLDQIKEMMAETIVPPQSYYGLVNNDKWAAAVSISHMLQSVQESIVADRINTLQNAERGQMHLL
jgi:predicted transcriptional regulator